MKPETLANRLKDDAARGTPAFDSELHERVLASVERAPDVDLSIAPAERNSINWWLPLALAASIALGVGIWITGVKPALPVVTKAPSLTLPNQLFSDRAAEIQKRLQTDITAAPLAALDHDTRAFTAFVAGQLDVFPLQQTKER